MNRRVLSIMERERAAGFSALSGTHVEATVPITQRVLDLLVARIAGQRNLSGLKITLRANREIGVAVVKPVFGFETRLAIDLRIRGPVDLASDSRMYLVVARPSLTWSAISRLVLAAGLAPASVEIGTDGVAIDLRMLASRAGVLDLVSLVRSIDFESEDGVLRVHVVADVPEGGVRTDRTSGLPGGGPAGEADGPTLPEPDAWLTELRGARIRGRIAISEELANQAIGLALDIARAPRGAADPASPAGPSAAGRAGVDAAVLAGWVQRACVRFENGRIVLEPDVVIG